MPQSQSVSGLIVLLLWFLTGLQRAVFLNFLGEQGAGQEVELVVNPSPLLGKDPLKIHPRRVGEHELSGPVWWPWQTKSQMINVSPWRETQFVKVR